jgi:microcystin degradation protein MlrC
MKIAVAQLYYEGNDFNLTITDLEDFVCHEGAEVLSEGLLAGEIGGFVSAIRDQAVISDQLEILPTLAASALSGGRVSRVAFEDLCKRLITPMAEAGDVDAVLLSLHGATIVEGIDDAEGLLLVRLRQLLGRHLPIVVTLDLHANVTEKMVAHADILVGYQTCPHEDAFDTGFKAAQYLLAMLKTGKKPQLSWQKLPMITPVDAHNTLLEGVYKELFERLAEIENCESVLSASLFSVQPWLDIPDLGFSVLVYTWQEEAQHGLHYQAAFAEQVWASREELLVEKEPLRQSIKAALVDDRPPVILVNASDSIPAGAPGDNTLVLAALLEAQPQRPVYVALVDPEAAQRALQAGVGAKITLPLGGKRDTLFCSPLTVSARVGYCAVATAIIEGPVLSGGVIKLGLCAILHIGELSIVVTTKSFPGHDPAIYRSVGLCPESAQAVVVNSAIHYRANYRAISENFVLLDTPGASTSNFSTLPFRRIRRPIFPLDPVT